MRFSETSGGMWQREAGRARFRTAALVCLALLCSSGAVFGQALRFGTHRELAVPTDATIRLGPFYSTWVFTQAAGYRYTTSSGTGTDFLIENSRGEIQEDGSDFPIITVLSTRNYLILTRNIDIDASIRIGYEYYPLGTQADEFILDIAEEGIFGSLSSEIQITPSMKATLFDTLTYTTDYVDTRGLDDPYGGREYEYFRNTFGVDYDWLMTKDDNLGLSVSRTDNLPQDDEFDAEKYANYDATLLYQHAFSPYLTAGLGGGLSLYQYDLDTRPDTLTRSGWVFADSRITRRSVVSVSLGMAATSFEDPVVGVYEADEEADTVIGSASLTTELSPRLEHSLAYAREMQQGFNTNAAFEIVDRLAYRIDWKGEEMRGNFQTVYQLVDGSRGELDDYTDWTSAVELVYPLQHYLDLVFVTSYAVRENEVGEDEVSAGVAPESRSDYDTWNARIGTKFGITDKLALDTYLAHTERFSDDEQLEYSRETFETLLTYTHEF